MPNVYEKEKPSPGGGSTGPGRYRYSTRVIIGLLMVLALLIVIFGFTRGEAQASVIDHFRTISGSFFSEAGVLT